MTRFSARLCLFFAPFVIAFSLPAFVLGISGELLSADEIARRHLKGLRDSVYGAAYTNPDARYKLASITLDRPDVLVIGSSRALQFRSDHFSLAGSRFYNAGLLVERLHEYRKAFEYLPAGCCREVIVVLDQWYFNEAWPNAVDNPFYAREIAAGSSDVLNHLQRGALPVWQDYFSGRLKPGLLLRARENIGVSAILRGDGFRRDGSFFYADALRSRSARGDEVFSDALQRIALGTRRFEYGENPSPGALEELALLMDYLKSRDYQAVVILAPFAPAVFRALQESRRHGYIDVLPAGVRDAVERAGFPFFDFSACEPLACVDAQFIDGVHPGSTVVAAMLIEMARHVEWIDRIVDQEALRARLVHAVASPELPIMEGQ